MQVRRVRMGRMTAEDAVAIRKYQPADADGVMALAPRLTEWVSDWRDPAAVWAAVHGWIRESAAAAGQDGHAFYVAVAGGEIVGLVTVCESAHFSGQVDAYVGELAVAHGWEGRGIARRLMRSAEDWAVARGLPFICLDTGAANGPARGLYASLGFQPESVRLTKPTVLAG